MDTPTVLHATNPINYDEMSDEQLLYIAHVDREAWYELQERTPRPSTACTVMQRPPFEVERRLSPCKQWPDCQACPKLEATQ